MPTRHRGFYLRTLPAIKARKAAKSQEIVFQIVRPDKKLNTINRRLSLHTRTNIMSEQIGCDISQKTIDVFNIQTDSYVRIENNLKGFKKFKQHFPNVGQYHICMEATGNYYEEFADYLHDAGYKISVVNPLRIKYFMKSEFCRLKTDKQDAKMIALYCQKMKPKPDYKKPTPEQYQIKRLISHIKQLLKQQTAIKNRIKSSKDDFIKSQLHQQLKDIKTYIKTARAKLSELNSTQSCEHLNSIPAIGNTTSVILHYYLSLYDFDTAGKFTAFAGLSPSKYESGTSVKKSDQLSHLGNRTLKTALYMSAVVAYRIELFKGMVERLKRKGKPNKVILAAIMRKLAVLAWILHTRNEDYRKPA